MSEERLVRVKVEPKEILIGGEPPTMFVFVAGTNHGIGVTPTELQAATVPQPSRGEVEALRKWIDKLLLGNPNVHGVEGIMYDVRHALDALCAMASQAQARPDHIADTSKKVTTDAQQAAAAMCGSERVESTSKGGDTRTHGSAIGTATIIPQAQTNPPETPCCPKCGTIELYEDDTRYTCSRDDCDGELVKANPSETPDSSGIDPGNGYRLLKFGEVTEQGDEWYYESDKRWVKCYEVGVEIRPWFSPYRRKLPAPPPIEKPAEGGEGGEIESAHDLIVKLIRAANVEGSCHGGLNTPDATEYARHKLDDRIAALEAEAKLAEEWRGLAVDLAEAVSSNFYVDTKKVQSILKKIAEGKR